MESREYYELEKEKRRARIIKDMNFANEPDMIKIFIGNEDKNKINLINQLIELNNITEVSKLVNDFKDLILPMDIDLLKELYILNKENIDEIEKDWLPEFKSLSKAILWQIPIKERFDFLERGIISENYRFHLTHAQLLNIRQ